MRYYLHVVFNPGSKMQHLIHLTEEGKRFLGISCDAPAYQEFPMKKQKFTPQAVQTKRTVVYLRVSKRKSTTENQKVAMEAHLASLQGQDVTVLEETGSSLRRRLPILSELMDQVRRGEVSEIHMWRVCRAGRDHGNDVQLWNLCVEKGVRLFFVSDHIDSRNEDDREWFYMQSIMAERERRLIGKRVKEAFERMRRQGTYRRPPGRVPGSFNREVEAKIPTVLLLKQNGYSSRRICRELDLSWRTLKHIIRERSS